MHMRNSRKGLVFIIITVSFALILVLLSNAPYFWKRALFTFGSASANLPTHRERQNKSDPNILDIPSLNIRVPIV